MTRSGCSFSITAFVEVGVHRAVVLDPDAAIGAHRHRVAQLSLGLVGADRHRHHLALVFGDKTQRLLHRNLVERIDLVAHPFGHDAGAIRLDLDLRLGVFHSLGGYQDLHRRLLVVC